jgi:rhamnosyltransferase
VIPTKNGGALFKEVVTALTAQTLWSAVDFIVVDSGSHDDTLATARAAGARCFSIPPHAFNHGATRDFAISQTTCARVVLMVQDAVPAAPRLIENLLAALDEEGVAGVYARQLPRPHADVITRRNLKDHFTGGEARDVRFLKDAGVYDAMSPAGKRAFCNFDNVCSAIRKDVWEDERFGYANFGEDLGWAERVLKRGYGIVYEPKAVVIHSHDRPLAYEYDRAYICHRTLYRQFGLSQVPTVGKAIIGWAMATMRDVATILGHERNPLTMIGMLVKAPLVNGVLMRAKYAAERDERRGTQKAVSGV